MKVVSWSVVCCQRSPDTAHGAAFAKVGHAAADELERLSSQGLWKGKAHLQNGDEQDTEGDHPVEELGQCSDVGGVAIAAAVNGTTYGKEAVDDESHDGVADYHSHEQADHGQGGTNEQ